MSRLIALTGPPGAGKSTTAGWLTGFGFQVVSRDDLVLEQLAGVGPTQGTLDDNAMYVLQRSALEMARQRIAELVGAGVNVVFEGVLSRNEVRSIRRWFDDHNVLTALLLPSLDANKSRRQPRVEERSYVFASYIPEGDLISDARLERMHTAYTDMSNGGEFDVVLDTSLTPPEQAARALLGEFVHRLTEDLARHPKTADSQRDVSPDLR